MLSVYVAEEEVRVHGGGFTTPPGSGPAMVYA